MLKLTEVLIKKNQTLYKAVLQIKCSMAFLYFSEMKQCPMTIKLDRILRLLN